MKKKSHKSKAEQARLDKARDGEPSTVKVVGNGFIRRSIRPAVQGGKVKSQLVRVDANFAKWLRQQAKIHGSVTEVTRKLNDKAAILSVMIESTRGD